MGFLNGSHLHFPPQIGGLVARFVSLAPFFRGTMAFLGGTTKPEVDREIMGFCAMELLGKGHGKPMGV